MNTLKDKQHQAAFVGLILPDINRLVKNKDGSYIVKEIYRHFDASFIDQITQIFKSDFEKNISDKFSICIFKEIAIRAASEKPKLDALYQEFIQHFQEFKINTFYHFGIQYFVEVRPAYQIYHQRGFHSADLSSLLLEFAKNPKNVLRSRSTSETILLSLSHPPTQVRHSDAVVPEESAGPAAEKELRQEPLLLQDESQLFQSVEVQAGTA